MLEIRSVKDLLDALGKLAPWLEDAGQVMGPSAPPPDDLVRKFAEALNLPQNNPLEVSDESLKLTPKIDPAQVIAEADLFNQEPQAQTVSTEGIDKTNQAQQVNVQSSTEVTTTVSTEGIDKINQAQQVNVQSSTEVTTTMSTEGIDSASQAHKVNVQSSTEVTTTETDAIDRASQAHEVNVQSARGKITPLDALDRINQAQQVNLDRGFEAIDSAREENVKLANAAQELIDILQKDASQLSPADLLRAQQIVGVIKYGAESGVKVSEGISETFEQLLEQQG